jgi:adenylate cyclase
MNKVTIEDNALAEEFFQQAIDLDPSFAGGYKGLAAAQANAADFRRRGLPEALSSTEALARRAVAFDNADAPRAAWLRRRPDRGSQVRT